VIEELLSLCHKAALDWTKRVYFMGQLVFEGDSFWNRLLHNQTSYELQRKLLFEGFQAVILPIRVDFEPRKTKRRHLSSGKRVGLCLMRSEPQLPRLYRSLGEPTPSCAPFLLPAKRGHI